MDDLCVVVTDKMVDAGWAKFRDFDDGEGIYRNHLKQVIEAALAAQTALIPADDGWMPIATAIIQKYLVDRGGHVVERGNEFGPLPFGVRGVRGTIVPEDLLAALALPNQTPRDTGSCPAQVA